MTKKITLIACIAALFALSGCYKNDPLKEKERMLEAEKNKTEQEAGQTENNNTSGNSDKGAEGSGDSGSGSGDSSDQQGNNNDSGSGEGNASGEDKGATGGTEGNGTGDPNKDTEGNEGSGSEQGNGGSASEEPKKPEEPEQPKEDEFLTTLYSFEHWTNAPKKKHTLPLNSADENPASSFWVSASNYGYDLAALFGGPVPGYPVEVLAAGYKGKGVRLRTIKASFALVAGALYSGKVNELGLITRNPTHFGQPCENEPLEMSFVYQYKAGAGKVAGLPNERDHASVQGVLYEVTSNEAYLDSKTIKNDSRIVSRAYMLLSDTKAGEWTNQTIKFEPISEEAGKSIDFKTKKYRLSLIISSSAKGDELVGTHLSELHFDELTLKSKKH